MKKSKMKKTLLALGCVAALAVSGIAAYFTATDAEVNTFDIEGVTVDLTEPSFSDGKEITPNETIAKDPTVTNTDTSDQFVFLSVKVPYKNIITAGLDGTQVNGGVARDTELFTWNTTTADGTINAVAADTTDYTRQINNGWTLIETVKHTDGTYNGMVEYIYAWGTADALTVLNGTKDEDGNTVAGGVTAPLFNSVTMCNAIEGQGLENTSVDINVDVFAIQASDLNATANDGNATTKPIEVYNIYANQWNSDADTTEANDIVKIN